MQERDAVECCSALLQSVYSQCCVAEEDSCLLVVSGWEEAWVALRAMGSWFLGQEPMVKDEGQSGFSPGLSFAELPPPPPMSLAWAAVDVARFRLAACSSVLRFVRLGPAT
mmetsp:Transcript_47241/g.151629  ORF Transcript_47241/g.151629 Transcript_47241/m.151629 type:complete len:111 (+) Transcript_47241:473-805(+)